MHNDRYNLEKRLLNYSVENVRFIETLPKSFTGIHIARQLLRSGTSAFPNHAEAQAAESTNDFIHKLRISLKELRETRCWLLLIDEISLTESKKASLILKETEELIKIFVASIKTAQFNKNLKKSDKSTISNSEF